VHLAYIWIISHLSAKNYRNLWKFDKVLTKTNLLSFLGHGVYCITSYCATVNISIVFNVLQLCKVQINFPIFNFYSSVFEFIFVMI